MLDQLQQMSVIWKVVITVVAFFVAVGIASAALDFFMGHRYPAWTIVVALVIVSPLLFVLWRDRFSQPG
jgi:uncharacterized membrane protein YjjP (DUF1212 family)